MVIRSMIIAATAIAVSGPAFAGRTEDQIMQHERAVKKLRDQQSREQQGLAGPVGEQGKIGPGTKAGPRNWNVGHPTERIRR